MHSLGSAISGLESVPSVASKVPLTEEQKKARDNFAAGVKRKRTRKLRLKLKGQPNKHIAIQSLKGIMFI